MLQPPATRGCLVFFALWLGGQAAGTDRFDPDTPAARFEGPETWDHAGAVRLWGAVERWDDPDRELFHAETFNAGTAWRDGTYSPWIATAFGTSRPPSSTFLLHEGPSAAAASGTPILLLPGAGDNASRAFATLAPALDLAGRPVYAVTFAHPHGDVFLQAEVVANAIAAIRARTGADQVDVVAHSKGGVAAAVYAASEEARALGNAAYAERGTRYRGDVRRLVLIAVPLGGIDASYRWSGMNLVSLDADAALSPTSWSVYYPGGVAAPWLAVDLADQDFLPDGRDLFPGQRQLLSRQPAPLPGARPWLGVYALQQDWFTTYEGGFGFVSWSDGIDAAIEAGGDLIARLGDAGIDPDIDVFQLVGTSPLLVSGDDALSAQFALLGTVVDYAGLLRALRRHGVDVEVDDAEVDALEAGRLVLGEISDRSDGLVFASSAGDERAILRRGGRVVERYDVALAHLDLLYATPATGQALIAAAAAGGPGDAWMDSLGRRYLAADTVGWVAGVLADEAKGDDPRSDDLERAPRGPALRAGGGCDAGGANAGWLALLAACGLLRRLRT